jgi:hypothetical protein
MTMPNLAGSGGTGTMNHSAQGLPQDRLVRKEVALGVIREYEPPEEHIGLRLLAPFQSVESDDVIFDYTIGLTTGLAPARAEDAESELAQKDVTSGYGRAAILDWALKDHYDPSDVSRYREALLLRENAGATNFPLTIQSMTEGFQARIARDERLRRRKLDNRIEWMITQALETGGISYNDGKIKFTVDFGRPAGQDTVAATPWDSPESDPIKNILDIKQHAQDTYGVTLDRAIISSRILNSLLSSEKFNSAQGGNPHPFYTVEGWGIDAARNLIQRATGVNFIVYDSVYRTRPIGSTTITNNKFLSDSKVYFLPSTQDVESLDDTIGFGATLTSPHPEGNWGTGFYEWERSTVDPWGMDRGTGIKAFPVFPHLDLTYVLEVLA